MSFALILLLLAQDKPEHTKDTLDEIQARLRKNEAVLLDTREQKEWDEGHLEAALLLPLSALRERAEKDGFAEWLAGRVSRKLVVYVHCKSGARSLQGAALLRKQGYDARALKPGFEELKRAGFPAAQK